MDPLDDDLLDYDSGTCSIARTAQLLGDRWTTVILRDLFHGVRRFDRLCAHLGIARAVLAARLDRLVGAGLVERREYREAGDRARHEYVLTAAGRDLRPVLVALMDFGDAHLAGASGPPMSLRHRGCGAPVHAALVCDEGHAVERDVRTELVPLAGARQSSGDRVRRS